MDRRIARSLAAALAVAAVALLARPTTLSAQNGTQPTVTVLPFAGVANDAAEAMADELALRLVETGRFRVLLREWLPQTQSDVSPTLPSLRQAATDADVTYLILGSVKESVVMSRRPSPLSLVGSAISMRRAGSRPIRQVAAPSRESVVLVNVHVLDVASGDVVRSALGRSTASTRPLARSVLASGLIGGPVNALARLASRRTAKPSIDARAERAIADIASTLNLSNLEGRSQKPEVK